MNPEEIDPENRKIPEFLFLRDKQEKEASLSRILKKISTVAARHVLDRLQKEEEYQPLINDILKIYNDPDKLMIIIYELAKTLENEILTIAQKSEDPLVVCNNRYDFTLYINKVGFSNQSQGWRREKEFSRVIRKAKWAFPQMPEEFMKAIGESTSFHTIEIDAYDILPAENVTIPEILNHLPYRLRDLNLNPLQILEFYYCKNNRKRIINYNLSVVFITYYNQQYYICNIFPNYEKKMILRWEPYNSGRILNFSIGYYPHCFIMPKRPYP